MAAVSNNLVGHHLNIEKTSNEMLAISKARLVFCSIANVDKNASGHFDDQNFHSNTGTFEK